MAHWTAADIPDQTGRTVLVTGANSGLGLHSARVLAAKGARVLMACRDTRRGERALHTVAADARTAPELVELDLADLGSVRKAADRVRERSGDSLAVLMNNAGIMGLPYDTTRDGFELQIGTNHLGHAALTWLLMPALRGGRVVTLSSLAHRGGNLDIDDLHFRRRPYSAMAGYTQSKLANMLFALELDRRARHAGLDLLSVAAHPGMSDTNLPVTSLQARATHPTMSALIGRATRIGNKLITQPVARGALPQLYAATAEVSGGSYTGPGGVGEIRGYPAPARISAAAANPDTARRLWEVTADLTGIDPEPR